LSFKKEKLSNLDDVRHCAPKSANGLSECSTFALSKDKS